jgi:uncharacterized membrane protein SpoIIM required for sporulation
LLPNRWIALRQDNWQQLATLLSRCERQGLRSLAPADLRLLGILYRQLAADLSTVRSEARSETRSETQAVIQSAPQAANPSAPLQPTAPFRSQSTLEAYLNQLLHRAQLVVYRGGTGRISPSSALRFLLQQYPRLVRSLLPYLAASFALFVVATLLGALCTSVRPDFARAFLGPQMMDTINHHRMWTESILSAKPQASSAILTNNITVCFLTFASGITFGLGTLFLLFNNGWQMGIVAAACAQHGLGLSLASFVASHGALELPSIFLAGAAGLRLGTGLLFPGYLARKAALARAGAQAIQLVAGTVPLLIVAGLLEAFLSPTHVPAALKFSVGASLFTLLVVWLTLGGRHITPSAA